MKKVLYVFDDINYESGAQKATFYQMECLKNSYDIYALSLARPHEKINISGTLLITQKLWDNAGLYTESFKNVMAGRISLAQKILRLFYTVSIRMGLGEKFLEFFVYGTLKEQLENFDTVIVVSEASKLRKIVSQLKRPKKIQWIHTDYALWSQFSEWTRAITKNDNSIYKAYDHIVVLTERCREGTVRRLPQLADKITVIPNLIQAEIIRKMSEEPIENAFEECGYRFVTVGRIDKEKNFDRVLKICEQLSSDKINFCWYIIGDGPLMADINKKIKLRDLSNQVIMLGRLENPYPIMKQCDYFVLLSDYEGTPVTIDEAAVLGIPVIATDVGGIPEQLERFGYGTVLSVQDDMYEAFKKAIASHEKRKNVPIEDINQRVLGCLEEII